MKIVGFSDFEFNDGVGFNDIQQEYFTDLHKNTHKLKSFKDGKPSRFSFLESYINTAPQCYGEGFKRIRNGEIFITD